MMIRNFFHFYYVWRKQYNRWNAIKCAWILMWVHKEIDKKIKRIGLEAYARELMKEVRK